jgi:hypothetical protein
MSLPVSYAFIVAYYDAGGNIRTGLPQAFKYERKILFLLIYSEEEDDQESEMQWFRADACTCIEIVDIYTLQELMERDKITLRDLGVIKDFGSKYTEEVSG